jgi:hypothetical protein
VWLGLCLFFASWTPLQAEQKETRTFTITVDGKSAGSLELAITDKNDGTQSVDVHARVDVRIYLIRYTYSYDGTEEWSQGRLMRLRSSANDDGKALVVSASASGNNLAVRTTDGVNNYRWDVWTTSYWRLAAQGFRNQTVPLIDADTGKYLEGKLTFVRNDPINIAGKTVDCAHYRLIAPNIHVNLWYDEHERLVHQTSKEQGRMTVFTLTAIN